MSTFEIGRLFAWEPPNRLALSWRGRDWAPGETTQVAIDFAPTPGGTQVTIEHSGFDGLPADHPARHGLSGVAFKSMIGLWWADLVTAYRGHPEP